MTDSAVSVRMPSSLVQKLKSLSEQNHFMDMSEELRSVIRAKTKEYKEKLLAHQQSGRQVSARGVNKNQVIPIKTTLADHDQARYLAKKDEVTKKTLEEKREKLLATIKQLIKEIEDDKTQ